MCSPSVLTPTTSKSGSAQHWPSMRRSGTGSACVISPAARWGATARLRSGWPRPKPPAPSSARSGGPTCGCPIVPSAATRFTYGTSPKLCDGCDPASLRYRTGPTGIRITWPRVIWWPRRYSAPACAAIRPTAMAWKPDVSCYYFINESAEPSFVIDVSDHYETKRRALACHASQFRPAGGDAVATRLTTARFQQLIESRDAQFGAQAGFAFAEGCVVRHPVVRTHLLPDLPPDEGRR